jgi:uncharacterized phiE125 gp8 family phage protein
MHRPVLVTPPAAVVSLEDAKAYLREESSEQDAVIGTLIAAAVRHLDGWTGILGACIGAQEWRQDFDRFARCLPLPLSPVISIVDVKWRNSAGQISTIASAEYSLRTDGGARSVVRFRDAYAFPGDLNQVAAVSVTYRAGHETVPDELRLAMLMLIGHWYEHRMSVGSTTMATPLPQTVDLLISPFKRLKL